MKKKKKEEIRTAATSLREKFITLSESTKIAEWWAKKANQKEG